MIDFDDLQIIATTASSNRLSYDENNATLISSPIGEGDAIRHLEAVAKAVALLRRYLTVLLEVMECYSELIVLIAMPEW